MRAFCFKSIEFSLLRISPKNAPFSTSQIAFSTAHDFKLTFNDYQLLNWLSRGRLHDARNMLDKMPERSSHTRIVYWTSLLSKYTKHGFVDEARALFDMMPEKNVVSYNAMLSGFLQCGRLSEGLKLFEKMPEKNVVSWTCMLCGLADKGMILDAKRLFEEMPERNVVSWNAMIVGLTRNGDLEDARLVFDKMPDKNVVSWNSMIGGYMENGRTKEARALFDEMEDRNVITWTSMVAGYCRAGEVEEGYNLFQRTPERNVVSWTAMIGGFTWNGFYEDAILLFLEMKQSSCIIPNAETFISLFYACAGMGFCWLGRQLHAQLIFNRLECDDYDGRLSKSLIHMYSSFGFMDYANFIFNKNSNHYVVQPCNCLINGYIRIGQLEKARNLFDTLPIRDKITWTSMIDGYFSVGNISEACHLFQNMPGKDNVAWTAMISGHVQNELFAEATYLFAEMQANGVSPLSSTYAVLFGAAGAMACLDQGKQLHSMLIKSLSDTDLILDNSLISMYSKCGEICDAYKIFSNMISCDQISWNSMIMGFSHHGLANQALKIFEAMLESGTLPNSVTFLGVLSACSHAGLTSKGWKLFNAMTDVHGIKPGLEHYVCMINLLGRAGEVKEAEEFILRLPVERNHTVWGALLGYCSSSEKIAKRAAARLLEIDPLNAAAHVALCNMYAASGKHIEEQKLRKEMGVKGARKVPGCSWIVLNGIVHVFLSGDKLDPQTTQMLSFLFQVC